MLDIGDTLFVVLCRKRQQPIEEAISVHVTRLAAERKIDELRRGGIDATLVVGPVPARVEL